jgi:hypothetical protein
MKDLLLSQIVDFSIRFFVEVAVVAPQLQDTELEAGRRHG